MKKKGREKKKRKICPKCGFEEISLGKNYGAITCTCDNPKLRKLLKKGVRVR
jgi:hypothetical protein